MATGGMHADVPRYDPVVAPQSKASARFVKVVGHEYAIWNDERAMNIPTVARIERKDRTICGIALRTATKSNDSRPSAKTKFREKEPKLVANEQSMSQQPARGVLHAPAQQATKR
jgi:hypothetical protein